MFLKKLIIGSTGLALLLGLAVTSTQAQRGKYIRGDNGRHLGWYKADGRRARGSYVVYRTVPRYYVTYPQQRYYTYYPQTYTRYSPRYVVRRGYQSQYVRRSYPPYSRYYSGYSYPRYSTYSDGYYSEGQYRTYRPSRRNGLSVSFSLGW